MSQIKEIFIRREKCVSCHSCELACAVAHSAHDSLFAAMFQTPSPRKRLYIEAVGGNTFPLMCRHCEDAPCAGVCLTGALSQDPETRIVNHNLNKCIGCWMCTMVCPFGVIGRLKERRKAVKCDRCPNRETPACVDACPTKALVYTNANRFSGKRRGEMATRLAGPLFNRE